MFRDLARFTAECVALTGALAGLFVFLTLVAVAINS